MSAAQTVRDIIEASRYLVLATADATGRPWSSPVYFAHIGFAEFYWVSSPGVTHSVNIAVRPEVGIAIFYSQAAIGTGQGVYMSAAATLVEGGETARGIAAFSARSLRYCARAASSWSTVERRATRSFSGIGSVTPNQGSCSASASSSDQRGRTHGGFPAWRSNPPRAKTGENSSSQWNQFCAAAIARV